MLPVVTELGDNQLLIGNIFTPLRWAEFAVEEFGLFQKWMDGATIFDPTMGEGNLLESLITYGIRQGKPMESLPVGNLFGNEMNTSYYETALSKFETKYGIKPGNNFTNNDFLKLPEGKYDIVFSNPPWQNFVDLPAAYKEKIKHEFYKYGLIGKGQNLLLGGSRIEFAALIIQRAIQDFLKKNGEAIVFMPLSLLLNDGANRNFRKYAVGETPYSIEKIFDFNTEEVFGKISTRFGLVKFRKNRQNQFPVEYQRLENSGWVKNIARPVFHATDPLSIVPEAKSELLKNFHPIRISKESLPRQGINTGGTNDVFFFNKYEDIDVENCALSNKSVSGVVLPKSLVFPLVTGNEFKQHIPIPSKWVFLPYQKNGKPLEPEQLDRYKLAKAYLLENKDRLQKRKGVMMNSMMKHGKWWALLGIGSYSFFPYKIIWEAYGRAEFRPKLFDNRWQVNQSLQAYIPVRTKSDANRILKSLCDKRIETYLLSLKMEGTMNWAQPGKIRKLVEIISSK
ncbi:MAG: N-6 DNA methylase [Bacteroidetes bacterium]|nr:N-6 DNA methylase [Bacteroidota bacterium]